MITRPSHNKQEKDRPTKAYAWLPAPASCARHALQGRASHLERGRPAPPKASPPLPPLPRICCYYCASTVLDAIAVQLKQTKRSSIHSLTHSLPHSLTPSLFATALGLPHCLCLLPSHLTLNARFTRTTHVRHHPSYTIWPLP
jgi:hypothetical protein